MCCLKNKAFPQVSLISYTLVLLLSMLLLNACSQSSNGPKRSQDVDNVPTTDQTEQSQSQTQIDVQVLPDAAGLTERISVSSEGIEGNFNSIDSAVNADGSIVAFDSHASNLVANDNNSTFDIFLHFRPSGETHLISAAIDGGDANGASLSPDIDDQGAVVVFSSLANNLVADDTNNASDVFIYEVSNKSLSRISMGTGGVEANGDSERPKISADGRYIVYQSTATNLDSVADDNGAIDIFLYDRVENTTQRISAGLNATLSNADSFDPSVSADASTVAFASDATNLVIDDTNALTDVFIWKRSSGAIARASIGATGEQASETSFSPILSADGNFVAFNSLADNLVSGDANQARDIFLRDLSSNSIELISLTDTGAQGNASVLGAPAVSADGRYVAFYTTATNMHTEDTNDGWDVFVRDRLTGSTRLASVSLNGLATNGSSFEPDISASGQYLVFGSNGSNLVDNDTNSVWDIFLHVLHSSDLPPVAVAGDDQQIYLGEMVQLDASGSFDPDVSGNQNPLQIFSWSIVAAPDGSAAEMAPVDTAQTVFIPDLLGEYTIQLRVEDDSGQSDTDDLVITVDENLAPTAALVADTVSGVAPLQVNFDASASSDPEQEALMYQWQFGDADMPPPADLSISQLSHTYTVPGEYTVMLTVTDEFGNSDQASLLIKVVAPNSAPVVEPTSDVSSGSAPLTVQFHANASDPDNNTLRYLWDFADGNQSNQADPRHEFLQAGQYLVTVTVSDGELQGSAQLTITVTSALELKARKIKIVRKSGGEVEDKLKIKACIQLQSEPAADDAVRLMLGNVELFNGVYSDVFNKRRRASYKTCNKHTPLVIDPISGRLYFKARKLELGQLNLEEEINLTLSIGDSLGSESLQFTSTILRRDMEHDQNALRDIDKNARSVERWVYRNSNACGSHDDKDDDDDHKEEHDETENDSLGHHDDHD